MPKKHSKGDLRKRLKVEAKRCSISVAELNKRLKSDGDGEIPVLPQDNIIVSRDTYNGNQDSQGFLNPSSNAFLTERRLCTVEEHLA
jgi:hypothetical protein